MLTRTIVETETKKSKKINSYNIGKRTRNKNNKYRKTNVNVEDDKLTIEYNFEIIGTVKIDVKKAFEILKKLKFDM